MWQKHEGCCGGQCACQHWRKAQSKSKRHGLRQQRWPLLPVSQPKERGRPRPQCTQVLRSGPCAPQEESGSKAEHHTRRSFTALMWARKTNFRDLSNRCSPDLALRFVTLILCKRHCYSFLPQSTTVGWLKILLVTESRGELLRSSSHGLNLFRVSCRASPTG